MAARVAMHTFKHFSVFVVTALLVLAVSGPVHSAKNPDRILISKGTTIIAFDDLASAADQYRDWERRPPVFLPAGLIALEINRSALEGKIGDSRVVLTETGIWGFSHSWQRDYYDHKMLREFRDLVSEINSEEAVERSGCPSSKNRKTLYFLFPYLKSHGIRFVKGKQDEFITYPGDFYYNFRLKFGKPTYEAFYFNQLTQTCWKIEIPKRDVNVLEISEGTELSEAPTRSQTSKFRLKRGAIDDTKVARTIKAWGQEFLKKSRVFLNEYNETYSCGTRDVYEYTDEKSEKIVNKLMAKVKLSFEFLLGRSEAEVGGEGEIERLVKTIQGRTVTYPEHIAGRTNFYLVGDRSRLEFLQETVTCDKENQVFVPRSGNEPTVYRYNTGEVDFILGKHTAKALKIDMESASGRWSLKSEADYKKLLDYFRNKLHLGQEHIHFLMRTMGSVISWEEDID